MDLKEKLKRQIVGQSMELNCTNCNKKSRVEVSKDLILDCPSCGTKAGIELDGAVAQMKKAFGGKIR